MRIVSWNSISMHQLKNSSFAHHASCAIKHLLSNLLSGWHLQIRKCLPCANIALEIKLFFFSFSRQIDRYHFATWNKLSFVYPLLYIYYKPKSINKICCFCFGLSLLLLHHFIIKLKRDVFFFNKFFGFFFTYAFDGWSNNCWKESRISHWNRIIMMYIGKRKSAITYLNTRSTLMILSRFAYIFFSRWNTMHKIGVKFLTHHCLMLITIFMRKMKLIWWWKK